MGSSSLDKVLGFASAASRQPRDRRGRWMDTGIGRAAYRNVGQAVPQLSDEIRAKFKKTLTRPNDSSEIARLLKLQSERGLK